MAAPPSYSNRVDPSKDRLPPYKASHVFANSQEELAALKEFAQSKMYVDAGTNGLLPDIRGGIGLRSMTWGGRMPTDLSLNFGAELTPETSEERKRRKEEERERKKAERDRRGSVGQRLMRVISGSSRDGASEGEDSKASPAQ